MNSYHKKLAIEQLSKTLERFKILKKTSTPPKGWIRAIRKTIGMTGSQLAKRLGVNRQRITRIEQDEILGNITLKTLRRTAEALNCELVYCLVPFTSLEKMVRDQVELLATRKLARVSHTMKLEDQELTNTEKNKALFYEIEKIINKMPRNLWDEA